MWLGSEALGSALYGDGRLGEPRGLVQREGVEALPLPFFGGGMYRRQLVVFALWVVAALIASFVTYSLPEIGRGLDAAPAILTLISIACYVFGVVNGASLMFSTLEKNHS